MNIDSELIERLLYEEEGATLDFKREQYRFSRATDDDKSELLKDILAFANGWRREDAYILIGVEEVRGGKGIPRGVTEHLNDSDLQQFVNSKTQRPVEFAYCAVLYEGKDLAVLQIPLQERPIYLKSNFGKLRANVVYIRRGSSTAEATPDEVARMGEIVAANRDRRGTAFEPCPELSVHQCHVERRRLSRWVAGMEVVEDRQGFHTFHGPGWMPIGEPWLARVEFINDPQSEQRRAEAVNVVAQVEYSDSVGKKLSIPGHWTDPELLSTPPVPPSPDGLEPVTIGIGRRRSLDIAVKARLQGDFCFAYNKRNTTFSSATYLSRSVYAGRILIKCFGLY
jgi:hypothetical protein